VKLADWNTPSFTTPARKFNPKEKHDDDIYITDEVGQVCLNTPVFLYNDDEEVIGWTCNEEDYDEEDVCDTDDVSLEQQYVFDQKDNIIGFKLHTPSKQPLLDRYTIQKGIGQPVSPI
jgi:hypothetical protein